MSEFLYTKQTALENSTIAQIQLDRPPVNALTPDVMTEISRRITEANDSGFKAIVFAGRERIFSAGLDVAEMLTYDRDGVRHAWKELFKLVEVIATSPIPVIAAITGHSPAGGAVLTLFCDYRIMAEGKFNIGLNEVQVGLVVPELLYKALALLVGYRHAARLATAGLMIKADEAERIGFVDELQPQGEVVARAIEYAKFLSNLPPSAMTTTRGLARKPLIELFDDLDESAIEGFVDAWFSDETQGALTALVEKLSKKR